MYKKYIIGGVLLILIISLLIALLIPTSKECEGCNNPKSSCYYLINKYDVPDGGCQYRIDNCYPDTCMIDKFSIYIENSGSMDSYMKTYTVLKAVVDELQSSASSISRQVDCYYINDIVVPYKKSVTKFAREGLTKDKMKSGEDGKTYMGNRNDTELSDVIDSVITRTGGNEVAVLISDFIPSPNSGSDKDIRNYISAFSNRIKGCLKNKISSSNKTCVMLCRFKSEYDGKYYFTRPGDETIYTGNRPFYALFIGDYGLIAKIQRESKIVKQALDSTCVYFVSQDIIPYGAFSGHLKSYEYATHKGIQKHLKMTDDIRDKAEEDSCTVFVKLKVDLSCLPCTKDYLLASENYNIESECFFISKVEEAKGADKEKYTHVITLKNHKATFPDNNKVRVVLKSKNDEWSQYNTLKAHQDINGTDSLKTLGIEELRQSIEDAFTAMSKKASCYAVFEFLIN